MFFEAVGRAVLNRARLALGPRQISSFALRFAPHAPSPGATGGKPSICLVEGWLGPGGAERQLCTLAITLKEHGHPVRVRVGSLAGRGGHYLPWLRENGVDVAEIAPSPEAPHAAGAKLGWLIPGSQRRLAFGLAGELAEHPCDVLHAFCDHPNVFGAWAGVLARIPVIRCSWLNRNPQGMWYHAAWMRSQYRMLARLRNLVFEANAVFCAKSYAEWLGLDAQDVEIVPNVLDPRFRCGTPVDAREKIRHELGIPDSAPVVIFSGRIAPEKRPFDMLKIFSRVLERVDTAYCVVAGSDFLDAPFREAAALLPPEVWSRLRILGLRGDMPDLLAASDALLLPSATEGLSNAILEAMWMGLPVVATRAGGTPELVVDGHNGFLAEIGDIETLAACLAKLLEDRQLREEMGDAGHEIAAAYTTDRLYHLQSNAYLRGLGLA